MKANARALGARLMSHGYKLVTDGTDNHLVLWDLRKEVSVWVLARGSVSARVRLRVCDNNTLQCICCALAPRNLPAGMPAHARLATTGAHD